MNLPHQDPDLLRTRHPHGHHRVTFLELFYDLVFVFAVTQLSHTLMAKLTLEGAAEALILLLALWWTWICTSWVTNWLDPEKLPVRIGLLVMMIAGLIFSSSLPLAFDSRGWAFAGSYFFMEVGRSLFFIWAARRHRIHRDNFLRILVWFTLGGLFWLAGAMCHDGWRLALWAVGLAVAYGSAWIGFWTPGLGCSSTRDWDIEGGHMAERCGLFMIISLGESVLVTGATFSELAWTAEIVTAFLVSIVGSMAMWWLYFSTNAEAASERFSKAADPGRVARLAYTYMHLLLVIGVILSAVADEVVLAHPRGHADLATLLVVLGAPAFFLLGNALFKWSIWGCLPASSMLGVGVLAAAAFVGPALAPLALLAVGTVVLLAVAVWEGRVSWCNRCLGGRPASVD